MIKNNIVPCYVFDGAKHFIQSTTHANRSDNRNKAKIALDSFYERGKDGSVETSDEEHNQAMRNIKAIATPNLHALKLVADWMKKEGIKQYCAAFEAEWQCLRLEQAVFADTVISKDDNCAMLGADALCYSVIFYDLTFKVHEKDNKTKTKNEENPLF